MGVQVSGIWPLTVEQGLGLRDYAEVKDLEWL